MSEQTEINEQPEATSTEKPRRVSITELLLTAATLVTAGVVMAMTDPKIPEFVGD